MRRLKQNGDNEQWKLIVKKIPILILTVTFVAAAVGAQQGREQSAPATSIQELANGRVHFDVTNSADVPITALVAIGTRTLIANGATDRSIRFFDSVIMQRVPKQIAPGATYTFNFFGPRPTPDKIKRDVQLKAAIFADGSNWGDSKWIETLLLRRSTLLRYSTKILDLIEGANLAEISRDNLVQELEQTSNRDFAAAGTTAEKQMVERAYQDAIISLQNDDRENQDAPLSTISARARSKLSSRLARLKSSKPALAE